MSRFGVPPLVHDGIGSMVLPSNVLPVRLNSAPASSAPPPTAVLEKKMPLVSGLSTMVSVSSVWGLPSTVILPLMPTLNVMSSAFV